EFKLKEAVVVANNSYFNFESTIVSYLNSIIPFEGFLGLGGGRTMQKIGRFMNICDSRQNLKIIQMIGGFSSDSQLMPSTSVIHNWSQALKATPFFLPASAIIEKQEEKDAFLNNKSVKSVYDKIKQIDMSVLSIGTVKGDSPPPI